MLKDGDYFYNSVKIVELLEVLNFRRIIFKFADLNAQYHMRMCTLNFVSLKTAKLQHLHVNLTKVSPPRMGTVFLEISLWRDFISRSSLVWQQFESGICRDRQAHTSTISLIVCMYNARAHTHTMLTLYRMVTFRGWRLLGWVLRNTWQHFEGSGISRCGEILRKYSISHPESSSTAVMLG